MLVLFCRELTGGIRKHLVAIMETYSGAENNLRLVTNMKQADTTFQQFLKDKPAFQSCIIDLPIGRSPSPKDFVQMYSLKKELSKLDGEFVFHGHGAKGGVLARILGAYMDAKVIYTPHGGSVHAMFGPVKNLIYALIEKALYFLTDHLVFESVYSYQSYSSRIHPESKKFVLNLNGVAFPGTEPNFQETNTPFVIGAFGALRKLKGFDVLISAISKVENPNIKIRIFGEGPERENLQKLIDSSNAPVELMGETSDALNEMKKCDLIVQPSHFESFGLTALEAISVGKPVIVSDAGGLKEIVQDGETGFVFPQGNSQALADKITESVSDLDRLHKMSAQAYRQCQNRFNENLMLNKLAEIYAN